MVNPRLSWLPRADSQPLNQVFLFGLKVGSCINRTNRMCVCVCVCVYGGREINFNGFSHATVEANKSEKCRTGHRAENSGRVLCEFPGRISSSQENL